MLKSLLLYNFTLLIQCVVSSVIIPLLGVITLSIFHGGPPPFFSDVEVSSGSIDGGLGWTMTSSLSSEKSSFEFNDDNHNKRVVDLEREGGSCHSSWWINYVSIRNHINNADLQVNLDGKPNTILKQSKFSHKHSKKHEQDFLSLLKCF
jgi:hypothetical protein